MAEMVTMLLGVLLFIAGYVLIIRAVWRRLESREHTALIGILVFMVYACAFAALAVLAVMVNDALIYMMMLGMIAAFAELVYLLFAMKGEGRRVRRGSVILLALYVAALLVLTVFTRDPRPQTVIRNDIVGALMSMIKEQDAQTMNHIALNVVLFMPLGFLLARVHPARLRSVIHALCVGLALSAVIEMLQMVFHLGESDVWDILANALGAAAGSLTARIRFLQNEI